MSNVSATVVLWMNAMQEPETASACVVVAALVVGS
jgi:hypothetical protein